MGFFKLLFGICKTQQPADPGCWKYADGKVEVNMTRAPELKEPGSALRFEGETMPKRVLIVHDDEGYVAFHNCCSHGGRRLDPFNGDAVVECCSVGKSKFDSCGSVLGGGAKEPIDVYPLSVEEGRIIVDLNGAAAK
jgi:nitrite reductase/ring-hydroxylating ferredoxin subunit